MLFKPKKKVEPIWENAGKPKQSFNERLECFLLKHFKIICIAFFIIISICLVFICYSLVGVSAVESGNYYNHLHEVI